MNQESLSMTQLPPEDLASFSTWFEEYLAEQWDQQIEADAEAGRLDHRIEKAKRDHEAGRSRPF
jgi:hypothetical protein